jgi:hypothetical protein
MAVDRIQATADQPGAAAPAPDVQALLDRIAFLEEQILEMRRVAMVEKARLASQRTSWRMRWLPKSLKMRPLVRPIERLIKRSCGKL